MANNPFDRTAINVRERPLSGDLNQAQAQIDEAVRQSLMSLFLQNVNGATNPQTGLATPKSGFMGDAFMPITTSPVGLSVRLRPGLAWFDAPSDAPTNIGGVNSLDDRFRYKPLLLTELAPETGVGIAVPAADPVNPRIDIIEIRTNRVLGNPTTRDVLNPGTGVFAPATVQKTLAFTLDGTSTVNGAGAINYKTGTPAPGAVFPANAPATTVGYTRIGFVVVPAAAVTIQANQIGDLRKLLIPNGGICNIGGQYTSDAAGSSFQSPPGVKTTMIRSGATYFMVILAAGSVAEDIPGMSATQNTAAATGVMHPNLTLAINNTVGVGILQASLAAAIPAIQAPNGQPIIVLQWLADSGSGPAASFVFSTKIKLV